MKTKDFALQLSGSRNFQNTSQHAYAGGVFFEPFLKVFSQPFWTWSFGQEIQNTLRNGQSFFDKFSLLFQLNIMCTEIEDDFMLL